MLLSTSTFKFLRLLFFLFISSHDNLGINQWRECGTPGYSMTYPTDVNIRKNSNRRNLNVDIDNNINNYEINKKIISYYKSMMNYFV